MEFVIVNVVPLAAHVLRPDQIPRDLVMCHMVLAFLLWMVAGSPRANTPDKPRARSPAKYDRTVHVFAKDIDVEFARFMFGDVDPYRPFPIVHDGVKYESEVGKSFSEAIFVWRPKDDLDGRRLETSRSEVATRVGRLREIGINVTVYKAIRDSPGWTFEEIVLDTRKTKVPRALSRLQ